MPTATLSTAEVSFFVNRAGDPVTLDTEQAEAIQFATLRTLVDNVEVYSGGQKIQATYDWNGDGKWILSEAYHKRHVYDVQVAKIEREINSGIFYLAVPEVTAFKLRCGLIIEYDVNDACPYVLHGANGGEIDRWDEVHDLAESVVDELATINE